jgi:hypothetical protein
VKGMCVFEHSCRAWRFEFARDRLGAELVLITFSACAAASSCGDAMGVRGFMARVVDAVCSELK